MTLLQTRSNNTLKRGDWFIERNVSYGERSQNMILGNQALKVLKMHIIPFKLSIYKRSKQPLLLVPSQSKCLLLPWLMNLFYSIFFLFSPQDYSLQYQSSLTIHVHQIVIKNNKNKRCNKKHQSAACPLVSHKNERKVQLAA